VTDVVVLGGGMSNVRHAGPAGAGVSDMFDTMRAAKGAGLAAPQIGVDLQLVIFGFAHNERYPDAPPVPQTVLSTR
jgi:peptide deformylase